MLKLIIVYKGTLFFYKSKFYKNAKTIEEHKKCWNPKNMRTLEAQPISTGSYKKSLVTSLSRII